MSQLLQRHNMRIRQLTLVRSALALLVVFHTAALLAGDPVVRELDGIRFFEPLGELVGVMS